MHRMYYIKEEYNWIDIVLNDMKKDWLIVELIKLVNNLDMNRIE